MEEQVEGSREHRCLDLVRHRAHDRSRRRPGCALRSQPVDRTDAASTRTIRRCPHESAPSFAAASRPVFVAAWSDRRALALAAAVVVGAASLGCSSSESTPSAGSAESAARTVTAGFGAGGDVEACLVEAFSDAPEAIDALATGGGAPMEQRDTLQGVLEICITPAELGGLVAVAISGGVTTAEDAGACVRDAVEELPDEQQAVLLVGLALSGDGDVTQQLDVDLRSVTTELFERCAITAGAPDPGGVAPGATATERPSTDSNP